MSLETPHQGESLEEVGVAKVLETARLGIEHLNQVAEDAMRQLERPEAQEKVKGLREKCRESLGAYMRLIVLSGLALVTPAHGARLLEDAQEIKTRARHELAQTGITREQRATYVPGINDAVYRAVYPYGYDIKGKLKKMIPNIIEGREQGSSWREDAWRLYLGLPQEEGTFSISDYNPKNYQEAYAYKINHWFDRFMSNQPFSNPRDFIRDLSKRVDSGEKYIAGDGAHEGDIMGGFTLSIGHDERGSFLYYYDVWDLAVPLEREKNGFLGRPYVIYDRLYFNLETFEPLEHLDIKRQKPGMDSVGVM